MILKKLYPRLLGKRMLKEEEGFSLFEILVCLFLILLVSIGIAANTIASLRVAKKTYINYLASNLALSKIESLAAYEAADIDTSFNSSESEVISSGTDITFSRTTTVTINADDSRTVNVVVSSNSTLVPTTVDFNTTYALWE